MSTDDDGWIDIDLEHPMKGIREAAGLSDTEAAPFLSEASARASVTGPERRGIEVLFSSLLTRVLKLGFEARLSVRRKRT